MSITRWAFTFLAFPIGGLLAAQLLGPKQEPVPAALAGALIGLVIGGAQWLALGRLAGWRWPVATTATAAVGTAAAVAITGTATGATALVGTGLITGLLIGVAQGVVLRRGVGVTALWAATVGISWAVGWFVTSVVIVDREHGYFVFGASGAIAATLITGLVLRRILPPTARDSAPSAASEAGEVVR